LGELCAGGGIKQEDRVSVLTKPTAWPSPVDNRQKKEQINE
jgi:hypothetical protein